MSESTQGSYVSAIGQSPAKSAQDFNLVYVDFAQITDSLVRALNKRGFTQLADNIGASADNFIASVQKNNAAVTKTSDRKKIVDNYEKNKQLVTNKQKILEPILVHIEAMPEENAQLTHHWQRQIDTLVTKLIGAAKDMDRATSYISPATKLGNSDILRTDSEPSLAAASEIFTVSNKLYMEGRNELIIQLEKKASPEIAKSFEEASDRFIEEIIRNNNKSVDLPVRERVRKISANNTLIMDKTTEFAELLAHTKELADYAPASQQSSNFDKVMKKVIALTEALNTGAETAKEIPDNYGLSIGISRSRR